MSDGGGLSKMEEHKRLLLANKAWVKDKLSVRPDYFERHVREQRPEFFWIGCSDSRVPAEEITGADAGELFVHRNVANMVIHTDFNMLSVLQYAVEVLHVKHVIVCGHYNCSGVRNAMTRGDFGLINKWLRHIKDIYRLHKRELDSIGDEQARYDRLVEINVSEQVQNLAETSFVQKSWQRSKTPVVHGWVYDLRTGYIRETARMDASTPLEAIYAFDYTKNVKDGVP